MEHKEAFIIGILRLIQHLLSDLFDAETEYTLSMDRTNWQLGGININILMIGVIINDRFIPIYFELLDKKGNSNQLERMELLSLLKIIFITEKPLVLAADREFIGKEWFASLQKSNIDFTIRVRKQDYQKDIAEQMQISETKLTNKIRNDIEVQGFFVEPIKIKGEIFYYHVQPLKGKKDDTSKSDKDIYIRYISTFKCPNQVSKVYFKRCLPRNLGGKIEVFFEDIKEKGIRLEEINFTDLMKIRLMVAVASLCYALCLKQGLIEFKNRGIRPKLDKKSKNIYLRTSIFTKGFSAIQQIAFNIEILNNLIISFLDQVSRRINNYPIIQLISKKIALSKSV
jgi:hypothetical protein